MLFLLQKKVNSQFFHAIFAFLIFLFDQKGNKKIIFAN